MIYFVIIFRFTHYYRCRSPWDSDGKWERCTWNLPEEDCDVLSVFDCDQNTIARIQPRLKRLRSATEAVILSSIPKTTRKRKRCNAGYAKKSRIVKRRRGRRFSRDTTNILEFTHGDLSSCSDILTHMKSIISILNLS